ncbi:FAD dependent oxidoreductase superfamily [Niveomyces insectorum RCEF 264]|uniref:FAD dependent oxidoreductase superfamily n=1 Tax=Niveomyces insectorum RCEF 264 TaxID=1081102 RepID=A0A167VJ22_9HYPO|nr:FAD dependent oxidoreductase superfamily [Niveomyces insectorum RCEF 264]
MPVNVVVLGAGVIGLSVALRLLEENGGRDFAVTVVARDFPAPAETILLDPRAAINYASPWAGAHNRWVPWVADGSPAAAAAARDHAFALATYRHMQALSGAARGNDVRGEAGVTFLPGLEYLEAPLPPEYTQLADAAVRRDQFGFDAPDLDLQFRVLPPDALPAGVAWGCAYRTWCVNPMMYCSFLLRRIVAAGGRLVKREVKTPLELFAADAGLQGPFDLVVNCSGTGFNDDNVFITRGQTCLVRNACDATVTRQNADGSWSFSVPRFYGGGTIIGGTKEPDNWAVAPSAATRARLLANFARTYPAVLASHGGAFDVVADIVGRRPTRRGGLRLGRGAEQPNDIRNRIRHDKTGLLDLVKAQTRIKSAL